MEETLTETEENMKKMIGFTTLLAAALSLAFFAGCSTPAPTKWEISKAPFGTAQDGSPVDIYTLRNARGLEARICTYGGIVVSLKAPDRDGNFGDVVLGFDKLGDYLKSSPFFCALSGRYCNRITRR